MCSLAIIILIVSLISTIFSVIFGVYQWWQKRKIVKLEHSQLIADTQASLAVEASNMMEVVNLLLRSISNTKDELLVEIKKVSTQLELHALQDTTVQNQINDELCKIKKMLGEGSSHDV